MLKTIDPKEHKLHQSTIGAFLDLLSVYHNFDLSPERRKKSTFLIAEDNKNGVYGGAVLYPQDIYNLRNDVQLEDYEDTFRGAFMTFRPQIQEFWIARICFCLEANLSPSALGGLEICEVFFREIYDALLAFGESKNTEFLPFYLCSFDTITPSYYKQWLYLPIWNSDDKSGLTHGILSLKGKKFIPRKPSPKSIRASEEKFHPFAQERVQ
jgi:hypothetical protein